MEDRRMDRQRTQLPARVTVTQKIEEERTENRVHGARLRDHRQSRYGAFPLRRSVRLGGQIG